MKKLYKSLLAGLVVLTAATLAIAETQTTTADEAITTDAISITATTGQASIVNAEGETIVIYSLTGAKVKSLKATSSVETIELGTGVYIIQVSGNKTKKVLVK